MITGLAIYLSYGTRSVGVVLICGLVIYEVVKKRIFSWYLVSVLCSSGILIVSQHYLFGSSESSYADQFRLSLHTVQTNVRDYAAVVASFWPPITGLIFSHLMFATVTGQAIYGMVRGFRWRAIRPLEATLAVYVPIILLWPGNQGIRFLLPVLPLYLAYALLGVASLSQKWRPAFRGALPLALAIVVLLVYAVDYRIRNFGTIQEAYGLPTFNDTCRYVRQNSSRQDTFVFYRARALSLFTDRPASIYFIDSQPSGKDREEQWKYFQKIHSRFIICSRLFEPDRKLLTPVIKEHAGALREVYHNTDFVVYRVDKEEGGRNR